MDPESLVRRLLLRIALQGTSPALRVAIAGKAWPEDDRDEQTTE